MTNKRGRVESVMIEVKVGDVDPMSRAARRAYLPLCGERDEGEAHPFYCTRAKGHSDSKDGPAALHVACGTDGRAVSVWP